MSRSKSEYSDLNGMTTSQPTTCYRINIKYVWGPHGKPYGDPTLITYGDMQ